MAFVRASCLVLRMASPASLSFVACFETFVAEVIVYLSSALGAAIAGLGVADGVGAAGAEVAGAGVGRAYAFVTATAAASDFDLASVSALIASVNALVAKSEAVLASPAVFYFVTKSAAALLAAVLASAIFLSAAA